MKLVPVLAALLAAPAIAIAQPAAPAPPGPPASPREAFLEQRVLEELAADGLVLARLGVALALTPDGDALVVALVEAIRIELDARAAPEAALARADQMLARWPAHALIADTRALRCRALRQLGRGAECAPPP